MQRNHSKGGSTGRTSSIRSTASSNDGDKSERTRGASTRYAEAKHNELKKSNLEKPKSQDSNANNNANNNNAQVPKRDRTDEDHQNRKKVKTTESPCNPVATFGKSLLNGLKNVFKSVFGSKKN